MKMLSKLFRTASLIVAVGVILPASANVVGYGNSNNSDCTFGCVSRYQQVYKSADFGNAPVAISRVSFFSGDAVSSAPSFTMRLATSAHSVDSGLDYNFDSNLGADASLFQTRTFSNLGVGDLVSFNGIFNYDPTMGDLLVDITRLGVNAPYSWDRPYLEASNDSRYQRAYSFNSTVTADSGNEGNYGNRTEFEFGAAVPSSNVPEPASLTLVALGLVGVALRRRKQA